MSVFYLRSNNQGLRDNRGMERLFADTQISKTGKKYFKIPT